MSKMKSSDYHEGYWERGEGSNYHNYGDDPGWNTTARIVAGQVGQDAKVLEVACAKGYFVLAARNAGLQCYGVDLSEYAVSAAPKIIQPYIKVGNAAVYTDLVNALPGDDLWLDAVVSNEFLEHVYEEEIDDVLNNMLMMVEPGGYFLHRIGLDMETGEDYAHQDDDCTHVLVRPRHYWEDKFRALGLVHLPEVEYEFDTAFRGRDWAGRYFAYQVPPTTAA